MACMFQASRDNPNSGSHRSVPSQRSYAAAVAAVSQPQFRPMISWMISIRGFELCSATTLRAKRAPSSAAVHAPSECLIGTMSLSMVFGRPTTVSS